MDAANPPTGLSPERPEPNWPKLLFVHDFRPESRLTADLFRQLFLGYPRDRLAWWYCRETEVYAQPDLQAGTLHRFRLPAKWVPNQRLSRLKSFILEWFWVPLAARHLTRTIRESRPDLVCVSLFGWALPVAALACVQAGVRLHVSLWDFPDTNAGIKVLGERRSQRFVNGIFKLVRRADSFDGISRAVLAEIKSQTGRTDGLLVHSGFEPKHLAALATAAAPPATDVLRIAYAGTIISEAGFLALLAALKKVRRHALKKIVLEFFGGRNYRGRDWFEPDWMVEHGMFSDEDLVAALRRCEWGIVVMDPAGEDLRYSRFSFPNKVGTYLSAGVPVLGFGHPQCSLGQIMQQHRLGCFTSAGEADELEKFLQTSLALSSPRDFFRVEILRCANTEFNAAAMRTQLWRGWGARD